VLSYFGGSAKEQLGAANLGVLMDRRTIGGSGCKEEKRGQREEQLCTVAGRFICGSFHPSSSRFYVPLLAQKQRALLSFSLLPPLLILPLRLRQLYHVSVPQFWASSSPPQRIPSRVIVTVEKSRRRISNMSRAKNPTALKSSGDASDGRFALLTYDNVVYPDTKADSCFNRIT
jgi:hypothetical protein